MPTRTQQSDILACAYASHGDTKQVLLFPSTASECFSMMGDAFDLAERLQTPVIMMSDLDLGMNYHLSPPLAWDTKRKYDRGKVLDAQELDKLKTYGRYLDVDDDGIPYRTIPATHPTKGAFVTRGTSRDEYARYTEDAEAYERNMVRLKKKWETARTVVPGPEFPSPTGKSRQGVVYFGTTADAAMEALDLLATRGHEFDVMRVKAFPFNDDVKSFFENHDQVFVIEQNRDAQFRSILIAELNLSPQTIFPVLNFDGMPITADHILEQILKQHKEPAYVMRDDQSIRP